MPALLGGGSMDLFMESVATDHRMSFLALTFLSTKSAMEGTRIDRR
jgi:hypothetical protein